MYELMADLKHSGVLIIAKVAVLSSLAVCCFHMMAFTVSASSSLHDEFAHGSQLDMYSITDTLTEPDAFSDALGDESTLSRLGHFISALDSSPDIEFLSAFDQAVPVTDFSGDERFDYGYGTEMQTQGIYTDMSGKVVLNAKSMQMTQAVFDFYRLEVTEGNAIPWGDVTYEGHRTPVLLGAEYRSVYAVGDVLEVDYYNEPFEFDIVGFVDEGASIYYHGDRDTYLDSSIIVPYPTDLAEATASMPEFSGILAFAMLSGDVAVARGTAPDQVLRELDAIANESGYRDYALLNAPSYLVQFGQITQLLQQNRGLILGLAVTVSAVAMGVVVLLSGAIFARRRPAFAVRSLLGESPNALGRALVTRIAWEHTAVMVSVIAVTSAVPNRNGIFQLVMIGAVGVLATCDISVQRRLLRGTPLHETEVT